MANLGHTFDANSVEPQAPRELLRPGDYQVQIVKSDMKDTKTGGQMLVLELEVLDGESKGRRVWDQLNLVNANQQAADIARRTLSAICHATGRMSVTDSEDLHLIPMMAKVAVRPEQGQYAAKNEVKGYSALRGGAPRVAAGHQAQPAQGRSLPWKKSA